MMRLVLFVLVIFLSGCAVRIDTVYPEDGRGPQQEYIFSHQWSIP